MERNGTDHTERPTERATRNGHGSQIRLCPTPTPKKKRYEAASVLGTAGPGQCLPGQDTNPFIRLSIASVGLPDGTELEQYVMRMRRTALEVVMRSGVLRGVVNTRLSITAASARPPVTCRNDPNFGRVLHTEPHELLDGPDAHPVR